MRQALAITLGIGALLVGIAGVLAIVSRTVPGEPSRRAEPERAPDFALQDLDGNTVRLADVVGKPLVVNSWAAWCPFCRKELVDFAAAQREFGERVTVIAIDRAEARDVVRRYSDEIGVTDALVILLDPEDTSYRSIGGFSMPETIFVDAGGSLVLHKRGPMNLEEIRQHIERTIGL